MKILIFESHNYHEEVILPQIEFLLKDNNKHEIYLLINENIKNKSIKFPDCKKKFIRNSKLGKFFQTIDIINFINKNKFDMVIFNSLEDKFLKIINPFLDKNIKKIAIVHNIDKLEKFKLDFKNFFVLSDHLLNFCKKNYPNYNFSSFYPLIYNKEMYIDDLLKNNNKNLIYITIPGLVEQTRRDYTGLINLIKNKNLNKNIKFIILGNIKKGDGPKLLKLINESNLMDRFILFYDYIPYTKFFSILNSSDLIMPLIHPNVANYEKYKTVKISASFNMAFSFKKPLLMFEEFKNIDEFKDFGIFYNFENFVNVINIISIDKINSLVCKITNNVKFSFKYQQKKYINFLESL